MYSNRTMSKKQITQLVPSWRGLNRVKGSESSGEMVSMKNMSSDNNPFASPRPSRETIKTGISNPQNLFSAGDKLGYIANGRFHYDGVDLGNVGNTSSIIDFNENIVMYPSNIVYDYVENELEDITDFLTVEAGSWVATTGAASTSSNNVSVNSFSSTVNYSRQAVYRIAETITTPGNESVIINSNIIPRPKETVYPYYEYVVRLYAVAFNGSTVISYDANGKYYAVFDLGNPVHVEGATSYKIMIGYSWTSVNGSTAAHTSTRNADFEREDLKIWKNVTQYPVSGSIPIIKYATVDNNRIFAVEGNNIYASSQGSYSEWTNFADDDGNPNPIGSYAEKLDTPQDITGITKYQGSVIITKPDLIYIARGNRPPYRIDEVAKTGCIDGRSIVEVNSVLYFLGRQGIYSYTGGQPRFVSERLNKTFEQGVAGTDGRKYYISAYDGTLWTLYVYDTLTGLWHTEDDIQCVGFAYSQGYLHTLTKDGKLIKFDSGNERVEWEFETQDFTFGIPNVKNIAKLFIRVEMQPYTNLDIYIRGNNDDYSRVANYEATGYTVTDFKVRVRKCDSFSLKFSGIGDVRILDIHGEVRVGSTKHKKQGLSVFRG